MVDIDSRGVLVEISENLESSFNRSVGHNFGLNGCYISGNRVGRLSVEEILSVRGRSSIVGVALLGAGRGSFFNRGAIFSTRRNKVWLAPLVVSVSVSRDDSSRDPIFPSLDGISSSASVSAGTAASENIFHRNSGISGLIRGNTVSISHSFSSTKSPTRSAISLISDFSN
jgi:hypothetical protein